MIKRGPQEWADWTGCYVNQDKNGLWYLHKNKPELMLGEGYWNPQKGASDFEMNIFSLLISASADHNWTTLYKPRPYSEKSADSINKEASYSEKAPVSENKPGHLGEVYTHKEFQLVYSDTPAGLSDAVTKLIGRGWSLYSSPFAMAYGAEYYLHQAMVRGLK